MEADRLRAKRTWEHTIENRPGALVPENEDEPQYQSRVKRPAVAAAGSPPRLANLVGADPQQLPPRPGAPMYRRSGATLDTIAGAAAMTSQSCFLLHEYRLDSVLGKGTFGIVLRCTHRSDPASASAFACKLQFLESADQRTYLLDNVPLFVQAINEVRVHAVLTDLLSPGIYARTTEEQLHVDREVLQRDQVFTCNVVRLVDWVKCTLDVRAVLEPVFRRTSTTSRGVPPPNLDQMVNRLYGQQDPEDRRPLGDTRHREQMIAITEFVAGSDAWTLSTSAPYRLWFDADFFCQFLVQTMCTLAYLQRTVRFTHYDFRLANLLVDSVPVSSPVHSSTLMYQVTLDDSAPDGGGASERWAFHSSGEFIVKLNDFGFSRLESTLPRGSASNPTSPDLHRRVRTASDVEGIASPDFDASYDVHTLGCQLALMLCDYLNRNYHSEPITRIPLSTLSLIEFMQLPPDQVGEGEPHRARLVMQRILRTLSDSIAQDLRAAAAAAGVQQQQQRTVRDVLPDRTVLARAVSAYSSVKISRSPALAVRRGEAPPRGATPAAVLYRYAALLGGTRIATMEANQPMIRPRWISEMAARSIRPMIPPYPSDVPPPNENDQLFDANLYDAAAADYLRLDANDTMPRRRQRQQQQQQQSSGQSVFANLPASLVTGVGPATTTTLANAFTRAVTLVPPPPPLSPPLSGAHIDASLSAY